MFDDLPFFSSLSLSLCQPFLGISNLRCLPIFFFVSFFSLSRVSFGRRRRESWADLKTIFLSCCIIQQGSPVEKPGTLFAERFTLTAVGRNSNQIAVSTEALFLNDLRCKILLSCCRSPDLNGLHSFLVPLDTGTEDAIFYSNPRMQQQWEHDLLFSWIVEERAFLHSLRILFTPGFDCFGLEKNPGGHAIFNEKVGSRTCDVRPRPLRWVLLSFFTFLFSVLSCLTLLLLSFRSLRKGPLDSSLYCFFFFRLLQIVLLCLAVDFCPEGLSISLGSGSWSRKTLHRLSPDESQSYLRMRLNQVFLFPLRSVGSGIMRPQRQWSCLLSVRNRYQALSAERRQMRGRGSEHLQR